ncbi:MAG: hypothetical protein QF536_09735 [Arenicellales bacterium]|nr:hypothetical protein [Arenicellales bacterium]
MEKRKQRTPQELIAEQEAKLERLRLRQAKAHALTNPALAPLMKEKAAITKELREAKKLLGNGPQSAVERIKNHQRWINTIEDQLEEATVTVAKAGSRLEDINTTISETIQASISTSLEEKERAAEG